MDRYQVTLIFSDSQQAADTIADILNNHREARIAITLDEMISPDHPEYVPSSKLERIRANEVAAFSTEKPEMLRKADAKARAAFLRRKAVETPEHQAMMAEHAERKMREHYEIQRIIDLVDCMTCRSTAHQPCVSAHGTSYGDSFVHARRRKAADEYEKAL